LNAAVPLVAAMASRTSARVVTFGQGGDVVAEGVTVDEQLRAAFDLRSPWGSTPVHLGVRGVHNVDNALAAAAVGLFCGVALDEVAAGLASGEQSPWRMDLGTTATGARVLNDAYNAAPASMTAALQSLAALPADRRTAVLGVMAELGDLAPEEHRRIAELAAGLDIRVIAVDTDLYGVEPVNGVQGALEQLGSLDEGDAVLVKASRVAGLERVAAALVG
jgi:UDP-N-acetylmuramoyl-tripeptide--D-alanyl-D-alanine ligase